MILSMENIFSDRQAVTASAASTNVIDLGPVKGDMGYGTPIPLLAQVTQGFNNLTTLGIALQASDDEAFTAPDTVFTETLALADLKAGARIARGIVPYGVKKRYVRLWYTVTGTAPTLGSVTAGITRGNDETAPYGE